MSTINDYLDYISTANYGSDVREAIVSSIRECYKDATGHPDSVAALVQEYIDREEKIDGAVTALTGLYNALGEIVYSYDYTNNVRQIEISLNEIKCVDQITLTPGKWIIKAASYFDNVPLTYGRGSLWLSLFNELGPNNYPTRMEGREDEVSNLTSSAVSGTDISMVRMIELTEETTIYLWISHEGGETTVTPYMTAIRVGESTPSDGTSLVDQVVENTANISTLDSNVSTLQDDVNDIEDEIADVKSDLAELESSGLSDEAKQALLACFENVAWTNDQGQDYYDALESALYPPADLVSIQCVYTQSGTVYDNDTLDSLKSDLVVTANMSDSTTRTITAYTLSGTLTEGTSTITVAYGGKTTTFDVVVSHEVPPSERWTSGVAYTPTIIQNKYVEKATGIIKSYNGWDWTGYMPCKGASTIVVSPIVEDGSTTGEAPASNAFFAEDYSVVQHAVTVSRTQNTTLTVPANACWLGLSSDSTSLANCITQGVTPYA